MKTTFFVMITALAILSGCNSHPTETANEKIEERNDSLANTGKVSDMDVEFVTKAAQGGTEEVEMAKLAQENSTNKGIKSYGMMLERDHTKANNELKALAQSKGIMVPAGMTQKQMDDIEMLKAKKGADFDKEYVSMMIDDHKKDIDLFKENANGNGDADLRTFASNTLPTLQMHLDSIEAIDRSMKTAKK